MQQERNEVVNNVVVEHKEIEKSVIISNPIFCKAQTGLMSRATSGFCVLTNRHDAGISRNRNAKRILFFKAFFVILSFVKV